MILSYLKRTFLYIFPFLLFLLTVPFTVSCFSASDDVTIKGDTIQMHESSLLTMVECEDYTVVDVRNPWNGSRMDRYLLVPKGEALPSDLPSGVVIRTPLESCVLFSGIHAMLFEELGKADCIKGVCDADYIYSDAVIRGLQDGTVTDCGSSLDVDMERLVEVDAEAIFVLPYENGGYGKLERMKVPLVECADYMENSALGCAEWVRFYARLLGEGSLGDSIFNSVRDEYMELKSMAAAAKERPRLMCELKGSSAWYVPGGCSTMGNLYADAGADYIFASNRSNGSVPLAYEVVLDKASDADVWLLKYNSAIEKSKTSLLAEFNGYANFKPFRNGEVYACNTARKRVFEATAFHPERLLRELISIFHPGILPGYMPVYYEKMPE